VIPLENSEEMEWLRRWVEDQLCCSWRNGIFAADGSAIPLSKKPSIYGETFYDRKSQYSLNCQLVIMPHNLLVVDYSLGHPGSVHDAYAFQGTQLAQHPA
ncbi:hypothetical protein HYDPIDRAFT_102251, partial [Hydnomerulius pinastri MD-312]